VHFYPIPFPDNRGFIKFCVYLYFALQVLLLILHFGVATDRIMSTLVKKSDDDDSVVVTPPLVITSDIPMFGTAYKLAFRYKERRPGNAKPRRHELTFETPEFFDEDGTFLEDRFQTALDGFMLTWTSLKEKEEKDE
jgi:hypothetical protein